MVSLARSIAALSFVGLAATNCGKKSNATPAPTPAPTTASTGGGTTTSSGAVATSQVPQIGTINLISLGGGQTTNVALTAGDGCSSVGVMGLALGPACSTAPLAAKVLGLDPAHDFSGDGVITCDDFTAAKAAGKDAGLMLNLLCQPVMLNNTNVVSIAAENAATAAAPASALAISFAAWPGAATAPIGSWTAASAATTSYPAAIRVWVGTTLATLNGAGAIALTSTNSGTIQIPDLSQGKAALPQPLSMAYTTQTSTAGCAASVSDANCHWQDISFYRGEGDSGGAPNAAHIKVWADDKLAPTVIAVEGKYYYTSASAAHLGAGQSTCPFTALANTSEIYFQVVQKGTQVWGMFDFYDANHNLLTCPLSGFDAFAVMAANTGVCQNVGNNPAWVPCTAVSSATFPDIWKGEAAFPTAKALTVPASFFTNAPTAPGVCLTPGGCRAFQASDIK